MQIENIGNNERIGQLIDYLAQTIKDGDGFVREQAPVLAREVVNFQLVSSIVAFVVGGVILTLLYKFLGKLVCSKDQEAQLAGILFGILVVLIGSFFMFCSGYHVLQATFAPRMVVMNYVRSLK